MASTALVAEALRGLHFPATREEIIQYALQQNVPDMALDTLYQLPNRTFHSLAEVFDAVGQPR